MRSVLVIVSRNITGRTPCKFNLFRHGADVEKDPVLETNDVVIRDVKVQLTYDVPGNLNRFGCSTVFVGLVPESVAPGPAPESKPEDGEPVEWADRHDPPASKRSKGVFQGNYFVLDDPNEDRYMTSAREVVLCADGIFASDAEFE